MSLKNLRTLKADYRAKHRKFRLDCKDEIKAELNRKITERFLNSDVYKNCEILFAYVSTEIETDTSVIIKKALDDGKTVVIPKCLDRAGLMDFYQIKSLNDLRSGMYDIFEPDPERCELFIDKSTGVCLVPGLCFDMYGYRIGFGKGYYDRFLAKFGGITVGLCYSKCVEHSLPKGSHDIAVDILITEKYMSDNLRNC